MGKMSEILTGDDVGKILSVYLSKKPDKREICPMIMILMDYYADDHVEDHMCTREFWADGMRKRSMLQDLIIKWRKN